ncbi:MAG: thiamine pyrophosphate-binding protein [Rhodospirillaceae bacterium]|nr:thiamine pyrophosphate-binding protein [Rhodospirillaceae bacterium]
MSTNQLSGAEAMVRMLEAHGVRHVFGLCGDTSLPFYDAFQRIGGSMRHILARDERSAAYMADAYARVTGKVGVCEGPSGGGATYILPGVVEANESSIPVLAITTDVATTSRGRFALTELDQEGLFRPLAKFTRVIDRAGKLPRYVRAAFTQMTTGRPGAAHLSFPFDVQKEPVDEAEIWADTSLGAFPARRLGPDPEAVAEAAALLTSAKQPLFICGGGVVISGAEPELLALAEALGAAVATTVSGQGAIPETHPLGLGVVGSNGGSVETREAVEAADLVMFIGCRAGSVTTERWRHPAPGKAKIVHIDIDPATIGVNYRTDAAVAGDAKLALGALVAATAAHKAGNDPRAILASLKAKKRAKFDELARSTEAPIRPERLIAALQSVLPEDAVIVADPGTPCPYFSAHYEVRRPGRHFITNRAHGALGYSMSASIGAQVGRPDKKVVAVMGDGSFGFTAGEMETVVRLKLPITFVVVSNAVFGWIKAGQKYGFGERYFSVDFDRTDHARVAEAFGVKAWRVEDPIELQATLKRAVETDGPTLVDVIAQPLQDAKAPVSEWVA